MGQDSKLSILHVIPAVAPRYGGPSKAIYEMCQALQKQDLQPVVVTTDADGERRLPVELQRSVIYEGVPTIFFSRQWSEAFKYSHALSRWLDAKVSQYQVVHIHAVFSHSSLAAAAACRRHGVPYIVRPIGSLNPWGLQQKHLRKRLMWHVGVRQMLFNASVIHYTTMEEQKLAEKALGLKRGVVISLGVKSEILHVSDNTSSKVEPNSPLSEHPYIITLSRLHPVKGLELLITSFLKLAKRREFEHWRLLISGDGEPIYVQSLKNLVRQHGGGNHVLFSGWLEDEQKELAIRRAELLAMPSHQENFGLGAIEALARGVPVLVSPHVNLAEDIEASRSGWVVPLQPPEFIRILGEAMQDNRERNRRGNAGRELVRQRFLWSAVASQLGDLYSAIVKLKFQ